MLSNVDIVQTQKYKQMLGLTNINSNTNSSTLTASATILGNIYVSSYSNLLDRITILSNLLVSGNSIFNSNISINSNMNIYNNSYFQNNSNIKGNVNCSNMNVNGGLIVNNKILANLVSLNNIRVSSLSQFNNNLKLNNIISLSDTININSNNINLGNLNSQINMLGTATYVAVNQIQVLDKIITLNLGSSSLSTENGTYCGIQIHSSSGLGFIRTNSDATRYEIKAPLDDTIRYIATVDYDNNLLISGTTTLYGPVTTYSILNVNGNTILEGNTIFNSSLLTSGNTILENSVTALSNIAISGDTMLYDDTTLLSSFYVKGIANFQGSTSINSCLTINGNTTILGSITLLSNLNIFGNSLLQGKTSLNSILYISNKSILQGTTTIISGLNINGNTNIAGSTSIISNLNVSQTTILQGSSNLNSNLNVNGNIIINGNMTIGSIINFTNNNYSNYSNLYILSQIISQLPDYKNNTEAVTQGVPLWGFYRTGGILKIRLDDTAPILTLSGNSIISINNNTNYIEPGISVNDNITPYLTSISNTFVSNIITTEIPILTSNIMITQTSQLSIGTYNILYTAIDSSGNLGTINRTLSVINSIISSSYNSNNIIQTWKLSGSQYNITNGVLVDGQYGAWALNTNYLVTFNFNGSWSVILKMKALNWGNILQINFDPLFTNWSQGIIENDNATGLNSGISNIAFRDSSSYFSGDLTYWQSSLPPSNLYSNFNSTDGIYINISRNEITALLTISFYDNNGNQLDSKDSLVPFYYTNFNSLFSFTSLVNINWVYGFLIHKTDTYASISEFKTNFET